MNSHIASPCVGLCSTTLGDSVCRGCQRADSEIGEWFELTAEQRAERMAALDALRERVAAHFLRVDDAASLERQMRRHRIRFRPDQPPLSRAIELLRVGRDRIRDLRCYGLEPLGAAAGLTAGELHAHLNARLLEEADRRRLDLPVSRSPSDDCRPGFGT
ncbi:DUF1289 domain-containing protein [Billgrantia pellis]|uniref:DUF1289 domain-containing protein n=1 Tax=Billgrantia pellis TaxID=2606936 RepID=A0A7V7KHM2_9GAMM|nr:DUF1289 domain-containing protein [Halomonas pellis]KAA0013656.1 DUF1289 domain-containing protein [Halomonas pellis]